MAASDINGANAVNVMCAALDGMQLGAAVFAYDKPNSHIGNYVTVNHVGFSNGKGLLFGTVNVLVHIYDDRKGNPKNDALVALSQKVADAFTEPTEISDITFETLGAGSPQKEQDGTAYICVRVQATYSNRL